MAAFWLRSPLLLIPLINSAFAASTKPVNCSRFPNSFSFVDDRCIFISPTNPSSYDAAKNACSIHATDGRLPKLDSDQSKKLVLEIAANRVTNDKAKAITFWLGDEPATNTTRRNVLVEWDECVVARLDFTSGSKLVTRHYYPCDGSDWNITHLICEWRGQVDGDSPLQKRNGDSRSAKKSKKSYAPLVFFVVTLAIAILLFIASAVTYCLKRRKKRETKREKKTVVTPPTEDDGEFKKIVMFYKDKQKIDAAKSDPMSELEESNSMYDRFSDQTEPSLSPKRVVKSSKKHPSPTATAKLKRLITDVGRQAKK